MADGPAAPAAPRPPPRAQRPPPTAPRPPRPPRPPWTTLALAVALLAAAVPDAAGDPSQQQLVHEGNLKDLLSASEWAVLFGGQAADASEFAVVRPWLRHGGDAAGHRRRRGAEDGDDAVLRTAALGRQFELRLRHAAPLLDPHFALLRRHHNHSEHLDVGLAAEEGRCLYRGTGHRGEEAAMHMCDRLARGVIFDGAASTPRHMFILQPLPARLIGDSAGSAGPTHVLLRRSLPSAYSPRPPATPAAAPTSSCGLRETAADVWTNRTSRAVRDVSSTTGASAGGTLPAVYIETAVFVDRDLVQHMSLNFPIDTEREMVRFVLAMVNAVQLLYESPSLGRPVRLALKRLELLHSEPAGLRRSHDIDRFLSSFCAWQAATNPGGSHGPGGHGDDHPLHWDHALILTGLDLYVVGKGGKVSSQVVGLAPVAGMCSASSCTVNEGRHFESVYVVAHEIGHNLGMRHDGPLSDNDCDPGSYLMSPTLGSGKTTWSACSRHYLHTFLQSPQSSCLLDGPGSELLDHSAGGVLPGERFDADQQCMLKYGRGAVHSEAQPLEDACRDLHCRRDRYTWTSHPALDGTVCGRNKWCRLGRCVSRSAPLSGSPLSGGTVDGGWSEWSPFSDCASGCLSEDPPHGEPHVHGEPHELRGSTGVMVSTRRCNNPRPENGGRPCHGSDRRYRTCTAPQCGNVARTTIRDFADQTCGRARDVQPGLLGTGLQMTSNDPHEACAVWCHMRSGGARPRAWSFPDGTACVLGLGAGGAADMGMASAISYCVGGRCEEFRCERGGPGDSLFGLSPARCSGAEKLQQRPGGPGGNSLSASSTFLQRFREKGRRREASQQPHDGGAAANATSAPAMVPTPAALAGHGLGSLGHGPPPAPPPTPPPQPPPPPPLEHASGCHSTCVTPGTGLRLVRRRGAGPCRGNCTLQTCEPDILSCGRLRTPFEVASALCAKFRTRVRRLSGLGMQISAADDDRDRPCRVACQDEAVPHRFYLVNGRDGWFPFGTDCSRGRPVRAFCISGRCLEFGQDGSPLYEPEASLPLPARDRRRRRRRRGAPGASAPPDLNWGRPVSAIVLAEDREGEVLL